ncbi:hypothetical protein [Psychrobacter urativorans]|uniref:hypothetical protein n=1 Tax=Psychrobacter urativorans TaxID=45610 RepID=UPI001919ED8C|nr:hypothetical protein [Psychrobacter urativorans]
MSDTQDHVLLKQRQMQQRQILAMMGIGQWVQPDSPTMNIADIPAVETDSSIYINNHTDNYSVKEQPPSDQQPTTLQPVSIDAATDENYPDYDLAATQPFSSTNDIEKRAYADDITSSPLPTPVTSPSSAVSQTIEPLLENLSVKAISNPVTVAPFDLQAGRYGDWVLLADIQALTNDSQKLWQNITQALSVSCETSSFPICTGMDTVELANASLAGYIFKIGRSEEVRVAVLTPLPEGLTHPNFATVPTLDEMLADASLKRQLWQQLSSP